MTIPVTGITPEYGIEYLVQGEPARNLRAKLERNAYQIEDALARQAVPPPTLTQLQDLDAADAALADQLAGLAARGYTVTRTPAAAGLPEYVTVRVINGARAGRSMIKAYANDNAARIPGGESIGSYFTRLQAPIVINASGWWGSAPQVGEMMGAQILNGTVIKDWDHPTNEGSGVGWEALAMMRDGTIRTYDYTTSAYQMLADGVWNSWSQGSTMRRDGAPTDFLTVYPHFANVSGRTLIGDNYRGDLIIVMVPEQPNAGGCTGQRCLDITAGMNLRTLYSLDGGGSSQLHVDGRPVVRSSDTTPRLIGDVLAIYAPRVGQLSSGWWDLPAVSTYALNGTPQMCVIGNVLYGRGGWASTGTGKTSLAVGTTPITVVAAGGIPEHMRPTANSYLLASTSDPNRPGRFVVGADGSLTLLIGGTSTAGVASYYRLDSGGGVPLI